MKILIAGGAGYVGSVLTSHLVKQGHEVTVLDLLMFGGSSLDHLQGNPRFELVEGDIRDESLLATTIPGHDAVILLAAIVGEPACNRDESNAMSTNYEGAISVLRAAQEHDVKRFVFTSTCSNYGISDPNHAATEESPLKPLSVYSRSKVSAEQQILAAATDSFCPTVLRLSTAFGASKRMRFDLLVNDFTLAAFKERKIVIYGAEMWRPFVHTQDIAALIDHLLRSHPAAVCGEVFNVGADNNNLNKKELGELVQAAVGGTELEWIGSGTDPRSYRVDFSKSANQLGFVPSRTVAQGIQEIYGGLREERWGDPSNPVYYN